MSSRRGEDHRTRPRATLARKEGWARAWVTGTEPNSTGSASEGPSGAVTPKETPGPRPPAPRGGEDTITESKPAPEKGKTNYPHPTSTLCPPPPLPTGTLPGGRETTGPHLQFTEPRLSTAGRGGARAPATSHTPLPAGASLTTVPVSLPRVRCPQPPIRCIPQSHTSGGKGRSWRSPKDGRKKQKFDGSNLSSATLGDLRQVT